MPTESIPASAEGLPETARNLIDGLDMLTLSRNIFHTLMMAAEELSDKDEREAFSATLDYGITCLKDGIQYIEKTHGRAFDHKRCHRTGS